MMADPLENYRQALAVYSEELLETVADRANRFSKSGRKRPALERLEAALGEQGQLPKLLEELNTDEKLALAILSRSPLVWWRWDHAVRLLLACGLQSPYLALQRLLEEGLLVMRGSRTVDSLVRFHVADGIAAESLPSIMPAAPLQGQSLELPLPVVDLVGKSGSGWRESDGWELPLRLALLWRLAWRAPIKRTQQNQLFKRDHERIAGSPLLGAAPLEAPTPLAEAGLFIYQLAVRQGWLATAGDQQSPAGLLEDIWPDNLDDLLLSCAAAALSIDQWNELGSATPVGTFSGDMPSARFLLLLWLSTLPEDEGVSIDELARLLEKSHPPFNATGELVGALRNAQQRASVAREWTRGFLLGPMFQSGIISLSAGDASQALVRLSPLGRRFVGQTSSLPARPTFPQTLLSQPNHQVIVYRQGLSVRLLGNLVLFLEPKSLGAALTFEINADSVYYGLEAGLTPERMIAILEEHGGRALPSGLAESIRTWSQKRDRVRVFADASLFEFAEERDMEEAVARGLQGMPITDRILLVPGDQERNFKNLRITASRDYQFAAEQCVDTGLDGITLKVDLSKSDLMLESELKRFADPLDFKDKDGRRQFRVTPESLARALAQGLNLQFIEEWYQQRTGAPPPASVALLFRAANQSKMVAKSLFVITTESPAIAEGLLQHPQTAELFDERLGPNSLTVPRSNLPALKANLANLGITLEIQEE